ncbi:MAG: flagellar biosynthetic protein FliR [Parvularculaceae bacterium]
MNAGDILSGLPVEITILAAVFARVGAMMMTAPAFGDLTISPRVRLAAALGVTAALAPAVAGLYPTGAGEGGALALAGLLLGETAAGLFLGLFARAIAAALNVAGEIIALQIGLSLAQIFDPTQDIQGAIVGGFLAILGATLIFATDAHHLLLAALRDSYSLMSPGAPLAVGDAADAMIGAIGAAFSMGVRLAAPFIVFGLVFYSGAGVLNRLMPQAQVFFMLLPANLVIGLMLLMLTTGLMMTAFLAEFETQLSAFLG